MSKKHFIQLADTIRRNPSAFTAEAIQALAAFYQAQNSNFNREHWLAYIAGTCGANGGRIK